MKNSISTTVAILSLAALAQHASAAELAYNFGDTTPVTGTAYADSTTGNGDSGSFKLGTTGGSKASVYLYQGAGSQLGTLGDLNAITFDYIVNTNTTSNTKSAPAIRFFTNSTFTQSLVWENVYQSGATTDTGVWHDDVSILGGQLWQRANGHNFDQIVNLTDKAGFEGGFTPTDGIYTGQALDANTPIYGLQISFGSGIAGVFDANVDDVVVTFGGASAATFTANPVPEPTSLALLGLGGLTLLRRRR